VRIEVLIKHFLNYNQTNNRQSTTKRYESITNHFFNFLRKNRPNIQWASQITVEVMEAYKSSRRKAWVNPNGHPVAQDKEITERTRKGARARTINIEVDGIKRMLNLAVELGFLKENQIRKLRSLKEDDKKPVRYLTNQEVMNLLDAAPSDLYPAFFAFIYTGMRKAELENLQWSDVDLKRKRIYIRRKDNWLPKTGEREIPIGEKLTAVLTKLRRRNMTSFASDYVFGVKNSGHSHNRLRRELIKAADKAGIDGLTKLHTLRHTFASHLVMKGVDLPTVMKLLGHSDIQTTMIYAHLAADHLTDAVNKLEFQESNNF